LGYSMEENSDKINIDLRTLPQKLSNYLRFGVLDRMVMIEASSLCQLDCVKCPGKVLGQHGELEHVIGKGNLAFDNFKLLLDSNPWIKQIELSNWGELFLNPLLKQIIEYAFLRKVRLFAQNGVNLNTVSNEQLEALVKFNFELLGVSIAGATQKTYSQYHLNGDFNNVISNIEKINYYKNKLGSNKPHLIWRFVVFGHNQEELLLARRMAGELNMEFVPVINFCSEYSPIKNKLEVMRQFGLTPDTARPWPSDKDRSCAACGQLWRSPQINWDGKLLGCCMNIYGDYGNVFLQGLRACIMSKKYIYAKRMLLGQAPILADIPCANCPEFKSGYYKQAIAHFRPLYIVDQFRI
jgi:hypothetical protein